MSSFEEGWKLMEATFGAGKDNLIAVATMGCAPGESGAPQPVVRTVDAYYEDGVFYSVVNGQSNKIRQIAQNDQVAVAGCQEMFTAIGKGENLGWVMKPENAALRQKLRKAFAAWYDMANNDNDENCCILAVRLTKGTLNINHWEKLFFMDFVHRCDMPDGGIR